MEPADGLAPSRGALPPWPDDLQDLRGELDGVLRGSSFLRAIGGEVVDWGPGWSRLRLLPAAGLTNLVGTLHGGVAAGLADAAFEVACNSYGRICVAAELGCHYTAAARPDAPLLATAREVSRTRRTASYRIDVDDEDDRRLVAWCMALAYRTRRWHLPEGRFPRSWRERH